MVILKVLLFLSFLIIAFFYQNALTKVTLDAGHGEAAHEKRKHKDTDNFRHGDDRATPAPD
jgi:hypothetical protein